MDRFNRIRDAIIHDLETVDTRNIVVYYDLPVDTVDIYEGNEYKYSYTCMSEQDMKSLSGETLIFKYHRDKSEILHNLSLDERLRRRRHSIRLAAQYHR